MSECNEKIISHMRDFIARRRAEIGLSLDEVATRARMTKSHVWELEKGRAKNPTVSTALALCDALQCSLNSLLGRDVSQPQFTDQEMALIAAHRSIFRSENEPDDRPEALACRVRLLRVERETEIREYGDVP